jgi:replicative DNA helicase
MGESMADEMTNKNAVNENEEAGIDPEIAAMSTVHGALKVLDAETQQRVIEWVSAKLSLVASTSGAEVKVEKLKARTEPAVETDTFEEVEAEDDTENDGISAIAKKWMRRNALQAEKLSAIFSLGIDEIDLVARTVPGKSKTARMHNVFLLKGIASYLGTGIARFTHDQVKEALTHYDAFDSTNFASYFKTFAVDVAGNKSSGYTLTARGLTNATALLKEMAP